MFRGPCSAVTLCPQWGPGLRPRKVGVCHAHPGNAFQQGEGTTIVWGSKGGETRQGKASHPPRSPGTEYVQALRLLQGQQLEEGGGGRSSCLTGPALTLRVPPPQGHYIKQQIQKHSGRSREQPGKRGKASYSAFNSTFSWFLNKGSVSSIWTGQEIVQPALLFYGQTTCQ